MIHRGMDYATAIKRFVHKNGGRYPLSIDQLENTNHIRFLRKRYKDPMTGEDNWRLVHVGEAQIKIPTPPAGANPGLQGSGNLGLSTGQPGSTNPTGLTGLVNPSIGSNPPTNQPFQSGGGINGNGQVGTLTTSNIGNGQPVGGGQIMGVASVSKKQSIRMFNDKDHYNDWFFVYDLRLEQSGGTGTTVAEPTAAVNASGDKSGQGQQQPGTSQPSGASGPVPTPAPTPN